MGEFEKNIKDIFENAEMQPSDQLWEGLETHLKANKKRGIVVYLQQYGVAAAVVLTLGVGYLLYDQVFTQNSPNVPTKEVAEKQETEASEPKEELTDKTKNVEENEPEEEIQTPINNNALDKTLAQTIDEQNPDRTEPINDPSTKSILALTEPTETKIAPVEATEFGKSLDLDLLELMEWRTVAHQLQWRNKFLVPDPDFKKDSLPYFEEETRSKTLSASLANGSFNPQSGFGVGPGFQFDAVNAVVEDQGLELLSDVSNSSDQQENSISIGGGFGIDLRGRWGFKTGLQFSQYRFSSTSNGYSEEGGRQLPIYVPAGFDENAVFLVGEYNLTNTLSTISIPGSFSYKIVDRGQVSVALSAGLGVDYIIAYKIKGDLNFLEVRKVDFSQNTSFNRFNITGLAGLEVGYKLNERFGLSAEAFYRKYLTPGERFQGTGTSPAFYGFGLGINYYLKP